MMHTTIVADTTLTSQPDTQVEIKGSELSYHFYSVVTQITLQQMQQRAGQRKAPAITG